MKIQGRHLIVALLAVVTYLPAATGASVIGQDANTATVRTTDPPAGAGRVAVHVTVDKNRVRVGEWVRVNLTPPAGVNRPRFNVSFGDGKEVVTRKTQIDHKYDKVGHYDVYAWVVASEPPPTQPVPRVFLAVAPNPVAVGKPVAFNAKLSFNYAGIKYRFVFGDRDQTAWQDQPQTTHAYALANTYYAYVEIGAEDNGFFKPLRGSARELVRVSAQQPVSVGLSADPTTVEVGRPVTFNARAISQDMNISYRFVFGDGSPSDWQTSTQATHKYASPKTYMAYVQISSSSIAVSRSIISSARKPIQVIPPQRVSVDLTVDPTTVNTETLVTFTARVDPRDRNVRYRFVYGDGASSNWQVRPSSTHKYSVASTYFAYVEAGPSNNNQGIKVAATSKTKQITVTSAATPTPTPTPAGSPTSSPDVSPASSPGSSPGSSPSGSPSLSPVATPTFSSGPTDRWTFPWWYLLIVLLVAVGGYGAFKALFVPRPTFRPLRDAGSSEVDEGTKALAINAQILMTPDIADGQYRVSTDEPSLVRSVRREND